MSQPTEYLIDPALKEAMADACDGLDFETAKGALTDIIAAIAAQAKALANADYDTKRPAKVACPECKHKFVASVPVSPADAARSLAHTMKAGDEIFRLLQFAKGAPDSRPDVGADWLRALDAEQLAIVTEMINANARKVTP
jgi:hypothetical protein